MKTQKAINWALASLVIAVAVAAVSMSGVRVQAASETAPITLAQATQMKKGTQEPGRPGAPGSMKAQPKAAKVLCGGKTTSDCCKGISFCGCLYSPMPAKGDEDKPLSCDSSPPPKG
jgi:hypothetical protein